MKRNLCIIFIMLLFTLFTGCVHEAFSLEQGHLMIRSEHAMQSWLSYRKSKENKDGFVPEAELCTLTIEGNIREIPDYAFSCCPNLECVNLCDSIETIGEGAFYEDNSLRKMQWSKELRTIKREAFYGTGLEEVKLPDQVASIGWYAFMNMPFLKTVVLPDSLSTMDYAFSMEPNLSMVSIGNGIEYLGDAEFSSCPNLRELTLPKSIKRLKMHILDDSGIERLIISGSILQIDSLHINRSHFPRLKQIVFLSEPIMSDLHSMNFSYSDTEAIIYFLNENAASWMPNGENEWHGIPIVGIDSIEDLPPLE